MQGCKRFVHTIKSTRYPVALKTYITSPTGSSSLALAGSASFISAMSMLARVQQSPAALTRSSLRRATVRPVKALFGK